MRLLKCTSEDEFVLTKDLIGDDEIPPYAILSHTWKDGQEVTFNDLKDGTAKSKAGYDKIRFCGQQAKCDGLRYFWVDTCCIDKSNQVELQDAINSMFRWYKNATECYAYLSDVSTATQKASDGFSRVAWEPAFRASRWFSRGWTLQELLAPRSIKFFSLEGKQLGDKSTLEQQIHERTSIAVTALRGTPLSEFDVEERLSWAECRQTTRREDQAYSLLGIFGIYMLLNYGEGKENAFRRLRKKIEKPSQALLQRQTLAQMEKQNMLAWLSPLDPTAKHTAIRSLQQPGTSDWFLQEQAAVNWVNGGDLIWLHGPSGTGKTVLVSAIINHLLALRLVGPIPKAIAYHYCDFADPLTLDVTQIAGSLVRQVVEQAEPFPSAVRDLYYKCSMNSPQLDTLIKLLEKIVNQSFEIIYVIIDGVDECPNRLALLEAIQKLRQQQWDRGVLRVLLSSRPEYDLRQVLLAEPQFAILPKHVETSLETHVRNELAKISKLLHLPTTARENLVQNLVFCADGMFRWVQCQLDVLRKVRTLKALQTALETLPEGLYKTYDRILEGVQETDYEYVLRLLKWLVGSERRLSLEELAEGIALDPAKDRFDTEERLMESKDVLDLCGSLIRLEEDETVVLAHFSVKEYLLSSRLTTKMHGIAKFALQEDSSKHYVLRCLVTYIVTIGLHIQDLLDKRLNEGDYPLLPYAKRIPINRFRDFNMIRPWVETHFPADKTKHRHLVSLMDYTKPPAPYADNYANAWFVQQVIQCSLMCYWDGCTQRDYVCSDIIGTKNFSDEIADLFLSFQLKWQDPINLQSVLTHCDSRVTPSPMCTAAARGFRNAAQHLLRNGALVDGIPSPYCVGVPILRALHYNHEEMVQLLIESGADLSVHSPGTNVATVLEGTAKRSSNPQFIKKLLQDSRVDVNMVDPKGLTIYYWAKYDSYIGPALQQVPPFLEGVRDYDVDHCDERVLYSTILDILKTMRGCSTVRHHYGRGALSSSLVICGPSYYQYAAIFEEQGIVLTDPVGHPYRCNTCVESLDGFIRGTRFRCLYCIDTDLCADCYKSWKQSNGDMELCKGHIFYQIPRPSWYELKEGMVTEDGKTLAEVVEFLEDTFTKLLWHLL